MKSFYYNLKESYSDNLEKTLLNELQNESDKKSSLSTKKYKNEEINIDNIFQISIIIKNKRKKLKHSFLFLMFLILFFPIFANNSIFLTIYNTENSYAPILYYKNINRPSNIYLYDIVGNPINLINFIFNQIN